MKAYIILILFGVIGFLLSTSQYDGDEIELNRNFYQEEIEKNLEDLMLTGLLEF